MYKNKKVEAALSSLHILGLEMTEQDFADLAVACADQAGLSARDQRLFEQLLTAAVESQKNKRLAHLEMEKS